MEDNTITLKHAASTANLANMLTKGLQVITLQRVRTFKIGSGQPQKPILTISRPVHYQNGFQWMSMAISCTHFNTTEIISSLTMRQGQAGRLLSIFPTLACEIYIHMDLLEPAKGWRDSA